MDERLSVGTFVARIESTYSVRTQPELAMLVADLPEPGWLTRACVATVSATSRLSRQVSDAWRIPRATQLELPIRSEAYIGRSHHCDYVITGESVSRRHAVIRYADGRWSVDDCGSTNGTFLNGWRVSGPTEIRPGDELTLSDRHLILRAPRIA